MRRHPFWLHLYAFVFSCMGATYRTAKSGVGVASMGVMRSELAIKSIMPVVMAGVLACGLAGLAAGMAIEIIGDASVRFIERNMYERGHDFELLPFGCGRRMCPGVVLSQLVHCFNWELPSGLKPNDLDMTEVFGLTVPRANHLLLKPKNRLLVRTT
ncbi:hypothetical protein FNV43_RR21304 [Rhamnella rubrinervis]|uniref:V-type proton ATPase proteolipid subunit n=1 Tax=Rhamnella rubrinervis TaxID=2594499 RepID=A0A8K0E1F5_9ROSA|nr:hypothetical protein FNV43_RR21304 [Rhamnella rubrinervis]